MNMARITTNIMLSGVLIAAGLYLLSVESWAIHGMLFIGPSRYLLAASLVLMAAFSGVVASGWIRGVIAKPPPSPFRFDPTYVDPVYKGELLARYWYVILPAVICFILALVFAATDAHATSHLTAIAPTLLRDK